MKKSVIFLLLLVVSTGCAPRGDGRGEFFSDEPVRETCPACRGKLTMIPIVYGYPSAELLERARKGEVILGGCFIYEGRPAFGIACLQCGIWTNRDMKGWDPIPGFDRIAVEMKN